MKKWWKGCLLFNKREELKNFKSQNTQKHAFLGKNLKNYVVLTKNCAIMYMDEIGEKF